MNKLEEKKLLYKIRIQQDREAFGELYDHYIDDIFRFVYYKVSNRADAEDLTNEIFLKTWRYLIDDSKRDIDNFRALIYSTARSKVIDHYRKHSDREECSVEEMLEFETSDTNLEAEVEQDLTQEQILKNLKKLKDNYQEVIVLRYLQELSTKETAQVMDKSRSSVRVTLHRAIKKLKQLLEN